MTSKDLKPHKKMSISSAPEREIKRRRNKATLKIEVYATLKRLVEEYGFERIQLQTICQEANITANTLYRNFGDLETLIDDFGRNSDYWFTESISLKERERLGDKEFLTHMLQNLQKELKKNVVMQKMLLWGLQGQDEAPKEFSQRRERESMGLINYYVDKFKGTDIDCCAIISLLITGVYYLTLHSQSGISTFLSVDFSTKDGAKRMNNALEKVINMIYNEVEQEQKLTNLREKMLSDGISEAQVEEYIKILG